MSALAWLFGLGALAIAFPFLFHLIRQTPRGRTDFSSLMFLKPTPPRLTQRSRLQNILLLLLRSAAILLIAFAFMRPFLRTEANQNAIVTTGRDILILLDTSASMQTEGVWKSALEKIDKTLEELESGDLVALATFDNNLTTIVDFPAEAGATSLQVVEIRKALPQILPGFGKSELGTALSLAADRLESRLEENETTSKLQLILVSDLQRTSTLDTLQSFQWPAGVKLLPLSVAPQEMSNAAVTNLTFDEAKADSVQVRIANSDSSKVENFTVRFESKTRPDAGWRELPVYLPAGTTQSFEFARPLDATIDRVQLIGDDVGFDNTFYFAAPKRTRYSVLFIGDDQPDDANGLAFFLETCFFGTTTRQIDFTTDSSANPSFATHNLIVVAKTPTVAEKDLIDAYLKSGGTALFVLTDAGTADSLSQWTAASAVSESPQTQQSDYALLVDVDFQHALFVNFDAPGLNDFTGIKFWDHLTVEFSGDVQPKLLAQFDDRSPAIWETDIGKGKSISMASSWKPGTSMLSVSPKFPIMMNKLLDWAAKKAEPPQSFQVNQSIPLDVADVGNAPLVIKPDDTRIQLDSSDSNFSATEIPGIYQHISGDRNLSFAVNVDRSESTAEQLSFEQLESLGVKMGRHDSASEERQTLKRQDDVKIEQGQQFWKWLIIAAICFLFAETFVAAQTKTAQTNRGRAEPDPEMASVAASNTG